MKDKREPMLVLKGKDINTVMDALETQSGLEQDTMFKYREKDSTKLIDKIKEVMRLE
jgi:hypothetical protein